MKAWQVPDVMIRTFDVSDVLTISSPTTPTGEITFEDED